MGPVSGLSGRELEIARLVAAGSSNRQVAEALGVSVRTIDNHLYRIYRKVGVSDRESLARRIH
jgi:DNA-binding CsgD family transcriptional regulator